jgi:hypothetical protein
MPYAGAMSDEQLFSIVISVSALVVLVIVRVVVRKSSGLSDRLLQLVTSFGWEGPRSVWWSGGIRGRWRGFDVELRHMIRYKSVPERLLLTMKTAAPARVIVRRRTSGFLSKPITLFGPPLVEPMNMADRDRYWVRSDELAYVERLFSHAEVAPALDPNLIPIRRRRSPAETASHPARRGRTRGEEALQPSLPQVRP